MNEFASLLRSAYEDGSENLLTLANIRSWISEYLEMRKDEQIRFPTEVNVAHWDVLLADYQSQRDAMFVVAFFRGETVTFFAGRGNGGALRHFGENSFARTPEEIIDSLSHGFWIAGSTTVNRDELLRWVHT